MATLICTGWTPRLSAMAGAAGAMIVASRFSMKYAPAMSTASARENPGPDPLLGAGGLDGELGSVKSPPDCSSPRHHVERRRGGDHPGNTGPQTPIGSLRKGPIGGDLDTVVR